MQLHALLSQKRSGGRHATAITSGYRRSGASNSVRMEHEGSCSLLLQSLRNIYPSLHERRDWDRRRQHGMHRRLRHLCARRCRNWRWQKLVTYRKSKFGLSARSGEPQHGGCIYLRLAAACRLITTAEGIGLELEPEQTKARPGTRSAMPHFDAAQPDYSERPPLKAIACTTANSPQALRF